MIKKLLAFLSFLFPLIPPPFAMAGTYTTYYNLFKPALRDTNYVVPFAAGMDIIDAALRSNTTDLAAVVVSTGATQTSLAAVIVSTGAIQADLATEVSDRSIADAAIAVSTGTFVKKIDSVVYSSNSYTNPSWLASATSATYSTTASSATYATTAGSSTYATTAGSSTYATTAGSAPMDNLGNHIATTSLNMGSFGINSSSNISAGYFQIAGSTVLTLGGQSVYVGPGAGPISTGFYNVFVGSSAGYLNAGGGSNTFIGLRSGLTNSIGTQNTNVGAWSGYTNSTGNYNTFLGQSAGYLATASSNTFVGDAAGSNVSTGGGNTFIGRQAGLNATSGSNNIMIGAGADPSGLTVSNELNIGGLVKGILGSSVTIYGDLISTASISAVSFNGNGATLSGIIQSSATGTYPLSVSGSAGSMARVDDTTTNTTMYPLWATGAQASADRISTTELKFNPGIGVLTVNGSYFGSSVTVSGDISAERYQINGSTVLSNLNGNSNLGVGVSAGLSNSSGIQGTFVGQSAGRSNSTGSGNVFTGFSSGYANTSGTNNSYLGLRAGYNNATGFGNTGIGWGSLESLGSANYSSNTALGYNSGNSIDGGSYNLFLGYGAGSPTTSGSSNILLGKSAYATSATASNELNIGGLIKGYMVSPATVTVYGNFYSTGIVSAANGLTVVGSSNFPGSGIWNASGNVGIGVTNPAAILDVYGDPGTELMQLKFSGASNTGGLNIVQLNAGGAQVLTGSMVNIDNRGLNPSFYSHSNTANPVIIDASGNVGIGTTSPTESLHTTGQIRTASFEIDRSGEIAWNSYYSGGYKYRATGDAWKIYGSNGGGLQFYNAPSTGTADTAQDFTQRMNLDSAGNLGIGKDATAGYRLDVNGLTRTITLNMSGGVDGRILCVTTDKMIGYCSSSASCTNTCTCTCTAY